MISCGGADCVRKGTVRESHEEDISGNNATEEATDIEAFRETLGDVLISEAAGTEDDLMI